MTLSNSRRLLVLAVAVLLLGGLAAALVLRSASRDDKPSAGGPTVAAGAVTLTRPGSLAFLNGGQGPHRGAVASVPADAPESGRTASELTCQRFYAAAGTGVPALHTGRARPGQQGADRRLRTAHPAQLPPRRHPQPRPGLAQRPVRRLDRLRLRRVVRRRLLLHPYRDRGHPHREAGGEPGGVRHRHGRPGAPRAGRELLGVTFSKDDDTFYATVSTGGETHLVKGSISGRSVKTLAKNVECPSLSPDETRIAYKKRVRAGASLWREHVMDLGTLREHALAEKRSVDDQAAWLDDRTLAYGLPTDGAADSTDLWTVPADGSGTPRLLAPGAASPARLG